MLYTVKMTLSDAKVYNVVLFASVSNKGEELLIPFDAIMNNESYFNRIKEQGMDPKLDTPIEGDPSTTLPFLSYGESRNVLDITAIFNLFQNNPVPVNDPRLEGLSGGIKQRMGLDLSVDHLNAIIENSKVWAEYQAGKHKFRVIATGTNFNNVARTLPIIKNYNKSQGHLFTHIKDSTNITSFMNNPDDRAYLQIPEYERLINDDLVDVSTYVPRYNDVAKPYPHPIYSTPYWKDVTRLSSEQMRIRIEDAASWMDFDVNQNLRIPDFEPGLVLGYAENDGLDIKENELDYYNALTEFIKYDIQRTHTNADVETMYKEQKCSSTMLSYLQELLYFGLTLNWMHTGKVQLNYAQWFSNPNSTNDEEESDEEPVYFYDFDAAIIESKTINLDGAIIDVGPSISKSITDAGVILFNFIEAAANTGMGLDAYVQAIIKLLRWGHNKPRSLKLGNFDKYLDLNEFTIKSTYGDLSSLQTKLTEDGYEYTAVGYINFVDNFEDSEYLKKCGHPEKDIKIPPGIICEKQLVNGSCQIVFMSLFDVYSQYKNNPSSRFIRGISVASTSPLLFSVDTSVLEFTDKAKLLMIKDYIEQSQDKQATYYESDAVKRILLKFSESLPSLLVLADVMGSNNTMTKQEELLRFKNEDELYAKIAKVAVGRPRFVLVGMASAYLPTLLLADKYVRDQLQNVEVSEDKLEFLLNKFSAAAEATGFVSEDYQWEEGAEDNKDQQISKPAPVQDTAEKMTSFGNTQPQSDNQPPVNPTTAVADAPVSDSKQLSLDDVRGYTNGHLIREINKSRVQNKLVFFGEVHGYLELIEDHGVKEVVFATVEDIPDDLDPNNKMNSLDYDYICQLLASCLTYLITPGVKYPYVYFHSPKTILYLRKMFNAASKKANEAKANAAKASGAAR